MVRKFETVNSSARGKNSEDNENESEERAAFKENPHKVETSGCERAAGSGADLTIAHFQAPLVAYAAVLLSRSLLRASLASTMARAAFSSVRSPFRRRLASTAELRRPSSRHRQPRQSAGFAGDRPAADNPAGEFGLDSAAIDVEEVSKHLADCAQAADLTPYPLAQSFRRIRARRRRPRTYADQHEIALTGKSESLGDGSLFKQDAAVRRRVRHEGDWYHERLRPGALGQMVDDFVRVRGGSTGQLPMSETSWRLGAVCTGKLSTSASRVRP